MCRSSTVSRARDGSIKTATLTFFGLWVMALLAACEVHISVNNSPESGEETTPTTSTTADLPSTETTEPLPTVPVATVPPQTVPPQTGPSQTVIVKPPSITTPSTPPSPTIPSTTGSPTTLAPTTEASTTTPPTTETTTTEPLTPDTPDQSDPAVFAPADWDRDPGVRSNIAGLTPKKRVLVTDFGAVADDGADDVGAFVAAISAAVASDGGVVEVPPGTFHLAKSLHLRSGVVLRGYSADSTFLLMTSPSAYAIEIGGGYQNGGTAIVSGKEGSRFVDVASGSGFAPGELALITVGGAQRNSSSAGQVVEVSAINGSRLTIEEPLSENMDDMDITPYVAARGAGIETLSIAPAPGVTIHDMIVLRSTNDSWVQGVRTSMPTRSHVFTRQTYHCEIRDSVFDDAAEHGDGGRGYGVNLANQTTGCLVENNTLRNLRHSIVLHAGATANVVAFNHSSSPRHTNFVDGGPADISFHGYAVANLVEGNVVERIQITDAGTPGRYNTVLRNCLTSGPLTVANDADHQWLLGNAMYGTNEALRSKTMPAVEGSSARAYLQFGDVFDEDGIAELTPIPNTWASGNFYLGAKHSGGASLTRSTPTRQIPTSLYGSTLSPILTNPTGSVAVDCQIPAG